MSNLRALIPFFMARGTAPVGTLRHSYSIDVGGPSRGIIGYWFNNLGSITNANYILPNGTSAIIRQTMVDDPSAVGGSIEPGEMRFLLSSGGVSTSSVDQFPIRIVCSLSRGASVEFVPHSPDQIASFGQGIGRDYDRSSGSLISEVFTVNSTVNVQLFY